MLALATRLLREPVSHRLAEEFLTVPVDTINRVAPQLIATGRYAPPSLGVEVDEVLSRAIARQLGVLDVALLEQQCGVDAHAPLLRLEWKER